LKNISTVALSLVTMASVMYFLSHNEVVINRPNGSPIVIGRVRRAEQPAQQNPAGEQPQEFESSPLPPPQGVAPPAPPQTDAKLKQEAPAKVPEQGEAAAGDKAKGANEPARKPAQTTPESRPAKEKRDSAARTPPLAANRGAQGKAGGQSASRARAPRPRIIYRDRYVECKEPGETR
jgi:hypothetical protein